LDDHARFLLAAIACASPSGEAAWACFVSASSAYGLLRQLLSDNHSSFTGRMLGITVEFERKLAEAGVELINAAPAHPQTLGKLERFHRTLKEWLSDEGPAADLEHLQLLLDRFRSHYNDDRPHQGIGNQTPAERYLCGPASAVRLGELPLAEHEKTPPYPPSKSASSSRSTHVALFLNTNHRFTGVLGADDGTRTHDLLHGKRDGRR
jgi:Integrase core domain